MKVFTVVRIELGHIEANSIEETQYQLENIGFAISHSSELVVDETSDENTFWANIDIDRVKYMKEHFKLEDYVNKI